MMTANAQDPLAGARFQKELDLSTLVRCRAGDPIAFRAFVVRYERAVFALLSRMTGHGTHVEDLAQDSFIKAFEAFGRFDPYSATKPSTWLLTIVARTAIDFRKRHRVAANWEKEQVVEMEGPRDSHEARRVHLARALQKALQSLSDDQRAALVLQEYHEFTVSEVAVALSIPEGTVKSRITRARETLRCALKEWEEES